MTRSRRVLKIAKWTAAGLLVLSGVVWVLAANWSIGMPLWKSSSETAYYIGAGKGILGVRRANPGPGPFLRWTGEAEWFSTNWITDFMRRGIVAIPAWSLPSITLPLAAALFYADRRRVLPGHCRCGYDLTGNVSGRCPECGETVRAT